MEGGKGHLLLARKLNQEICIGLGDDPVVVKVAEIVPHKVRLRVVAPPEVPVHRREVWEAIRQRDEAAGVTRPLSLQHRYRLLSEAAEQAAQWLVALAGDCRADGEAQMAALDCAEWVRGVLRGDASYVRSEHARTLL